MAQYTITICTVTYGPWEEDAEERPVLSADLEDITFDSARELASYLKHEGLQSPSVGGYRVTYNEHTWLSQVDPYEHPYTGVLTEVTAHAKDVHPKWWAAVIRTVRWPGH